MQKAHYQDNWIMGLDIILSFIVLKLTIVCSYTDS